MTQPNEYLRKRELDGSYEMLALDEEIDGLAEQAEKKGIAGKTLIKLPGLSVVLVLLQEGNELEEHAVDGPATVQVLNGGIALNIEGERAEVKEGAVGVLSPGVPHDARALADSVLLLTFNEQG